MGGGNRSFHAARISAAGLSPRGRGKHFHSVTSYFHSGSIPAWAGETRAAVVHQCGKEVYPRVGGGNWWTGALMPITRGLSPRGRGKLSSGR